MLKLKEILKEDKNNYRENSKEKNLFFSLTKNPKRYILKYVVYCRKYNYFKKNRISIFEKLMYVYYSYKKNKLGIKLNLEINSDFGRGLIIYHRNIVINPHTKIGDNCIFHGNNCIGNNGKAQNAPKLGNNVEIGFGATIIGDIYIADDIKIGANSIVNKNFLEKGITIAGNPARRIK